MNAVELLNIGASKSVQPSRTEPSKPSVHSKEKFEEKLSASSESESNRSVQKAQKADEGEKVSPKRESREVGASEKSQKKNDKVSEDKLEEGQATQNEIEGSLEEMQEAAREVAKEILAILQELKTNIKNSNSDDAKDVEKIGASILSAVKEGEVNLFDKTSDLIKKMQLSPELENQLVNALKNDGMKKAEIEALMQSITKENGTAKSEELTKVLTELSKSGAKEVKLTQEELSSLQKSKNEETGGMNEGKKTDVINLSELKSMEKSFSKNEKMQLNLEQLKDNVANKVGELQKLVISQDKMLVQMKPRELGSVEMFLRKTPDGIEITVELEKGHAKTKVDAVLDDIKKEFRDKNVEVTYEFTEKDEGQKDGSKNNQKDGEQSSKNQSSFEEEIENILGG